MKKFTEVLAKVYREAKRLGIEIIDTADLDPYYKGDLDGKSIWVSSILDDDEELFNVLHLIGHTIQWNTDDNLRRLGQVLHKNPSEELLKELQVYEWEANCYSLEILKKLNEQELYSWLYLKYKYDMKCLTHFYKTGEKLRSVLDQSDDFVLLLAEKEIPNFIPVGGGRTRNGLIIDFVKYNCH